VQRGARLGYVDQSGRPLTFSRSEIDTYVAGNREQIRAGDLAKKHESQDRQAPPAGDRAVFAKAGAKEYYLRLPDKLCALNDTEPADRKLVDEFWAESAKAMETAKAAKPMSKDLEQASKTALDFAKLKSRLILRCDQREKLRAGGEGQPIQTYVTAIGMQKDRYDPSLGAGAVAANFILCGMLRGDVFKWSDSGDKDRGGIVAAAFKRLGEGEVISLRTREPDSLGCYVAWIIPGPGNVGPASDLSRNAKLRSVWFVNLGDWMVSVVTDNTSVLSPEDFFREFERDRALLRTIIDANLKK
jgi:hypothetical protein